jgi:restriction endonuclease S subunit
MELAFENVSLGNEKYFEVDNGERVRKQDIQKAQGHIPFYSSSKFEGEVMGYVSDKIKEIVKNAKKFNGKFLTVNADGSVGKVFIRDGEFYLNDVVNIIKILNKKILYEYLLYELQNKIDILGYGKWDKKLYKTELKQELSVEIPIDENGEFDLDKQKEIAEKYAKIEQIKNKLKEDYKKIGDMEIDINSKYEIKSISITGEEGIFEAEKGNPKYTKKYMHDHKGEFPVYSSQTSNLGEIGSIDTSDYDEECFTWTTDGTYVGTVFYRNGKFSITTHCGILRVKPKFKDKVDFEYLNFILNQTLPNYKLGEGSNKRLGTERMKEVQIEIPIDENGEFDLEKQKEIAEKFKKIEEIKTKLKDNYEKMINSKVQIIEAEE